MNAAFLALSGAVMGVGLLRLRMAWCVARRGPAPHRSWTLRWRRHALRAVMALAAAGLLWGVTGWPTLAATAAAVGWWSPTAWAARGRAQREQAVVEAVATWAEQLRDTLSAASGLEHAVAATASMATGVLSAPLQRMAHRARHQPLPEAVARFAQEVRHPSADFVAAALITASQHHARDVGALLGHLATSARDEARLRRRVWVGRARTRTASRLVVGVVLVVMVGLKVLNPGYLEAYSGATGQVVLSAVIAVFAAAFMAMERLSRLGLPERFTLRSSTRTVPS